MTVLVTGASRGIGRALADAYAARGEEVIGTARTPPPGDDWHQLDVADPQSVRALAKKLHGAPVDLLVCNAGIFPDKGDPLDTGFASDLWNEVFRTNVTGVFLTIQALLPNLRAARGKIAILSSRLGSSKRACGGNYIYRASKAAAINLGRNLASDLADDGIAVGIYHPGWVRTDMGGPGGDIDIDTSVRGLIAVFDDLSLATTGQFLSYDGTELPF